MFKLVVEASKQNVSEVAHSAKAAFFKHRQQLTEQGEWMKAQIMNDLRKSVNRSDATDKREVALCTPPCTVV